MKNLEIIEAVLEKMLITKTDNNLYSSVKKTTKKLISDNPGCKISELLDSLKESTVIGAEKLLEGRDFNETAEMLIQNVIVDPMSDSESLILFLLLKSRLVKGTLSNSYQTSKKAIEDIWNSMNKTE